LHNNLNTLGFNFRLFLDDDITEELLLETFSSHSKVDQSNLDAHFWGVMRVRQLRSHVETEVHVKIFDGITKFDLHNATLSCELRMHEDGVKTRIDVLKHVLNQNGAAILYSSFDLTKEGCLAEFELAQFLLLVHSAQPLESLLLRVNTETPTFSTGSQNTILTGSVISGKTFNVPTTDNDWVAHDTRKSESGRARNLLFNGHLCPLVSKHLTVSTRKGTEVGNASAG